MLSKKRNGWLWVLMLFAVCAVVYGALSSYPRELAVYSDELRYLDVARSLLQGRGLRVRNMPSDYQKILYPLCILPALLLKTTAAQITAIGWLNAVYMASAVFPAYALARAMGMNRRRTAFLVGVTAVLPTMSAASTFMSETVFLPLSLWQVYFFLRAMLAEPKARVGWCAVAGAFCYLLYLNKEVALYYLIAWVLVRTWVWWHDKASWRAELACNAALLGSFLACFLLAKATLFLEASTGLNDDLNGVERKVTFDIKDSGTEAQVVQSLAKWKRKALKDYGFRVGKGLYCDMNAIRRDEELDNLHSVYVDQWDWEKVIREEDRNEAYLKNVVRSIVSAVDRKSVV